MLAHDLILANMWRACHFYFYASMNMFVMRHIIKAVFSWILIELRVRVRDYVHTDVDSHRC